MHLFHITAASDTLSAYNQSRLIWLSPTLNELLFLLKFINHYETALLSEESRYSDHIKGLTCRIKMPGLLKRL